MYELDATPTRQLRLLVSTEPRFRSLGGGERVTLLSTQRAPWNGWASLVNVFPGFGLGSLAQGDGRGLLLTLTDTLVLVFAVSAVGEGMSHIGDASSSGSSGGSAEMGWSPC